jgi:hypothetical protein
MPDLSSTRSGGLDVEVAVGTVETTETYPGMTPGVIVVDFRKRRTAFLVTTASAQANVSPEWTLGADMPYVTSGHPNSVSGVGNIALRAQWTRSNEPQTRAYGVGLAVMVGTATENPDVMGVSDPEAVSEMWLTEVGRFAPGATTLRAHVNWRAGTPTFVQVQLGVDVVADSSATVLPRFALGGGGYVWRRVAVVAEGAAVIGPGGGHDLGDDGPTQGRAEAGVRYIGQRFHTGLRVDVFGGSESHAGYGVGCDVSMQF